MALSDKHWDKILKAISYKGDEPGATVGTPSVLKENWELLSDEKALDKYITSVEVEHTANRKAKLKKDLAKLD